MSKPLDSNKRFTAFMYGFGPTLGAPLAMAYLDTEHTAVDSDVWAVSLVTFLVWFFSRRAEEHRKKSIQQAIDESMAESWKQPDVRRPKSPNAV